MIRFKNWLSKRCFIIHSKIEIFKNDFNKIDSIIVDNDNFPYIKITSFITMPFCEDCKIKIGAKGETIIVDINDLEMLIEALSMAKNYLKEGKIY